MKKQIIAFDADDTLWVNETYFQETEEKFCRLLEEYGDGKTISKALFNTEMKNLYQYGFGVKGFILCMIETAMAISKHNLHPKLIDQIIQLGHDLLDKPVVLLHGIEDVLKELSSQYRLVLATKGDLLDQERKLQKSGLEKYFHHIEVMSDKKITDYQKLIQHLDCNTEDFIMIGNSLKSDVLPVIELGGIGIHVPYKTTWSYEDIESSISSNRMFKVDKIGEVLAILG